MKKNQYIKIKIKDIQEESFLCPECWGKADKKFSVLINDMHEKNMCIYCHNKIARMVYNKNNTKRRRTTLENIYTRYIEENNRLDVSNDKYL